MADVGGGGTTNVTLYDENGVQLGTAAAPLRTDVVDRAARALGQVAVTSIPEVEVRNDVGNPLSVTATNAYATEATAAGIRTDLGADGGVAPITGTGVRGWLRSVFDRLGDGSQRVQLYNGLALPANPLAADTQYKAAARLTDTARVASSGRLSLTLSGNIRAILVNPATLDGGAANTTSLRLERVEWYSSVSGGFASILTNVTGGIPTTPRRPKLNPRTLAQTTASSAGQPAIFVTDATSTNFTGGNDTGIVVPLPGDRAAEIDVPMLIAPGQNVALTAAYGKGVDSVITFFWSNL